MRDTSAVDPMNNMHMSQADYMKLFVQELNYQDPLKPMDNKEFMVQMAQFSLLQQTQDISKQIHQIMLTSNANTSVSLLGKYVTAKTEGGMRQSGTVVSVSFDNGVQRLTLSPSGSTTLGEITQVSAEGTR